MTEPTEPRVYQVNLLGLLKYLHETQGLERAHARRIVWAIFDFIRDSVLSSGHNFKLRNFGTFVRFFYKQQIYEQRTPTVPHPVLKFRASRFRAGQTQERA